MNTPTNADDIINSRDVIERIQELEDEVTDLDPSSKSQEDADDIRGDYEDAKAELEILKELAIEGSGYAVDWAHGEALIRATYFKDYAKQLAEECGLTAGDDWPNYYIDWDRAAKELQADFAAIDFDDVTYWIR